MKTKFILHGGGSFDPEKTNEYNTLFYSEILKDAPENAKVLLVPFAKDKDRISTAITKITSQFQNNKWQEKISIEAANEDKFLEQIGSADVIYFHGGVSSRLLAALKNYPTLEESLRGRIVAGESAGANVFTTIFYSPHANSVLEGLGILPLKMIPHYSEEKEGKLNGIRDDLEELFLPEYTYKIFYK